MRSVNPNLFATLAALALTAFTGCGSPSVDLPSGNDQTTSQAPPSELTAPSVRGVAGPYPYAKLALRGTAGNAVRVIVKGAGNPVTTAVQPVDGTFCVDVELAAAPAHYTLDVRTQGGDGRLSVPTTVQVDRANDAPPPSDATLCGGASAR